MNIHKSRINDGGNISKKRISVASLRNQLSQLEAYQGVSGINASAQIRIRLRRERNQPVNPGARKTSSKFIVYE